MPMAGAPRTTMAVMAAAAWVAVEQVTQSSDSGSLRWSSRRSSPASLEEGRSLLQPHLEYRMGCTSAMLGLVEGKPVTHS